MLRWTPRDPRHQSQLTLTEHLLHTLPRRFSSRDAPSTTTPQAQRGNVTYPRPHSWKVGELRSDPRQSCQCHPLNQYPVSWGAASWVWELHPPLGASGQGGRRGFKARAGLPAPARGRDGDWRDPGEQGLSGHPGLGMALSVHVGLTSRVEKGRLPAFPSSLFHVASPGGIPTQHS